MNIEHEPHLVKSWPRLVKNDLSMLYLATKTPENTYKVIGLENGADFTHEWSEYDRLYVELGPADKVTISNS